MSGEPVGDDVGGSWPRAATVGLMFRPVVEGDLPFLARVYASTRAEELVAVPWSEADKAAFLDMQFQAQHRHYRAHYPNAHRLVVMHRGRDVGRLYWERWRDHQRIIDIALLPEHRGSGLGTVILSDLMGEAGRVGSAVSIHVEKTNPAMRLYRRLGFESVQDKGVYDLMVWTRSQQNTAS